MNKGGGNGNIGKNIYHKEKKDWNNFFGDTARFTSFLAT